MHEDRARAILDTMDGAVSAAELGRRLWRDVPSSEAYLVLSEVLGHLDLLEAGGEIRGLESEGRMRWEPVVARAAQSAE